MIEKELPTNDLYLDTISCEFLYYSWIWLRKERYFLKNFFKYTEEPLSKLWFTNVSYLLKIGKYNYIKNKNLFLNKNTRNLSKIRNEVIQTAFFLRLFPLMDKNYFLKTLELKKQLRLLFVDLISLLLLVVIWIVLQESVMIR